MTPQDDDIDPGDEPRAMWRFPVWKRTIVMSAGSITHFALALIALWFAAAFVGLPNPDLPKDDSEVRSQPAQVFVGECVKVEASERPCAVGTGSDIASPAYAAGLRTNDVITQVGSTPVNNYGQLTDTIRALQPGAAVPFTYVRDGATGTATVTLVAVERPPAGDPDGPVQRVALAGVNWTTTKPAFVTYGATGAFPAVGDYAQQLVVGTFESLKKIPEKVPALWNSITGSERDPETPISVVGASRLGGEAIAAGLPQYFLMIFIALNVFIGIFNLLPLLPLDGGHIAIAWFERVRSWLYAKLKKPDPGRVDYFKLMPVTYAVILIGGAFTLLTVTADIVNPISIFR